MPEDDRPSTQGYFTSQPEVLHRELGATDVLSEAETNIVIQRLGSLVLDNTTVLEEHQRDAFEDIVRFYREGGRETYALMPTSTGKTVLFVEIARRLIEVTPEDEPRLRIIVLVPNVDLADQTAGSVDQETGKMRGFRAFAPELNTRAYHSQLSERTRKTNITEADVLVVPYNSFRNLVGGFRTAESKTIEEWQAEKEEYKRIASDSRNERQRLIHERKLFLRVAFANQQVKFVRSEADLILRGHQHEAILTRKQVKDLETLTDLANLDLTDQAIIRELRKTMAGMITSRISGGLQWLESAYGQTSNDEITTEIKEKKDTFLIELSDYEKLIARFLWHNRPGKTIKSSDLDNIEDRRKVYDLNERIRDRSSNYMHYTHRAKAVDRFILLRETFGRFRFIICDEAHRSIGTVTWDAITEFAAQRDIPVLGLTATDEYFSRTLEDYFESRAHELTKQEAIKKEIVNPIAVFAHETGLRFQGVSIDAKGDYDRLTIKQMRFSDERNMLGAEYAKLLSEYGYHGIMSAIPGDEGDHAKVLTELLNQQEITDPLTSEKRTLRARYILSSTPKDLRKSYYKAFERGELDWLVFVDVIREGWDSDRAKALINMRPTRSPLLATQRLGRIGRKYPGAPVSVAIDLFDGIEGIDAMSEIPPVLAADVFEVDNVEQGYIIGTQRASDERVLAALKSRLPQSIRAYHTRYVKTLEGAYVVDRQGRGFKGPEKVGSSQWQTFEALQKAFQGFLPKEILLEAVNADTPTVRVVKGKRGINIVPLFNTIDVYALHKDKPEVNPWRLHIDAQNQQWITPEGCTKLISKRFPRVQPEQIIDAIRQLEAETSRSFEKNVGRVRLSFEDKSHTRMGFTHLYKLEEIVERLVPFLINS